MEFKTTTIKTGLIALTLASATLFTASTAFADDKKQAKYLDNCQYLPLVNNPANDSVCVDAPVAMKKTRVVFDMSSDAITRPDGYHTGLRHMTMLGKALKGRIINGQMNGENISVIGVLHGSGIALAMKNSSAETKELIETIYALNNFGVNISLEVCGVTMSGKGLTNANLYDSSNGMIHVNQGAIGRIIDLQQNKYTLIKE